MYKLKFFIGLLLFISTYLGCTKAIIDEGSPTTTIDRVIKYDPDVQNIMFNNCITCHGGSAPSGGFTLTTYDDTRFYTESGNLVERINDQANPMPPSGLLSAEQRQIIAKWVADGFPEK